MSEEENTSEVFALWIVSLRTQQLRSMPSPQEWSTWSAQSSTRRMQLLNVPLLMQLCPDKDAPKRISRKNAKFLF
jgi:hypothetical protein